jgi:hypothetical protein
LFVLFGCYFLLHVVGGLIVRIDAKTDDSAKENTPKEEDALSNPNSKQEKNESNQEKTIDIEPQQQPPLLLEHFL